MNRPRLDIVAFATALQALYALALPPLYRHLLALEPGEARVVRWAFGLLVPAVALAVWAVLRPGPAVAEERRRRVLLQPFRLGLAVLGVQLLGLVVLVAALIALRTPIAVAAGVGACSAALLALPPVPVYAFARLLLLPVALEVGDETPPEGRRISLALQLGYGIIALSAAQLVPAAVFGAAQLDVAGVAGARSRAQATGVKLKRAAAGLDVQAATALCTATPLPDGERAILLAPSGTLLPEDAAAELQGAPFVEIPLTGALRGGTLRVTYTPRLPPRAPLLSVTLTLLLLAILLGTTLGGALARDLRGVGRQIDRVVRGKKPGHLAPVTTAEARRITRSANRLLERVPRFTIESFLAIEHAEEAQRLKSQFLANMSHDLRSPLNSILGFSELLLRGIEGPITPHQRTELEVIQDRGNQLLRLLTEILDTAKMESGKMELHRHSTPPAEILRSALSEARRGRPEKTVGDTLTLALQPGLPPIHVDPLRTTQALTHLMNWALDTAPNAKVTATATAKVTATATVTASLEEGAFVVEVALEGPLPDGEVDHLFDAFRLGATTSGNQDLHLALPLARRLAELHGGTLEVTSKEPTRLKMVLPASGLRLQLK